ncbi:MAG: heavy metal-associated domain-containing protein [Flavobacteriales bacterium]
MQTESAIYVENIKCGGCMNSIKTKFMEKEGVEAVDINLDEGLVKVLHDSVLERTSIENTLTKMGYPPSGENTLGAQAKSYVSCMVGRMSN